MTKIIPPMSELEYEILLNISVFGPKRLRPIPPNRRANFRRLANGDWGIWIQGQVGDIAPGIPVLVTRRDGSEVMVTVSNIVKFGPGGDVVICEIEKETHDCDDVDERDPLFEEGAPW